MECSIIDKKDLHEKSFQEFLKSSVITNSIPSVLMIRLKLQTFVSLTSMITLLAAAEKLPKFLPRMMALF